MGCKVTVKDKKYINILMETVQAAIAHGVLDSVRARGNSGVLQPIMPLDLPVKVRPWELTVYPRSHIRR